MFILIILASLGSTVECGTKQNCSLSLTISATVASTIELVANIEEIESETGVYKMSVAAYSNDPEWFDLKEDYLVIDKERINSEQLAVVAINGTKVNIKFAEQVFAMRWDEHTAKYAVAVIKNKNNKILAKIKRTKGNKKT